MNKKILLTLTLILLLTACKGQIAEKDGSSIGSSAYTGTKALEVNFVPNLPPNRVFHDQGLDVLLEIKNVGTEDVEGQMYLTGYDPNILRGIRSPQRFQLEKRTQFLTEGGIDNIEFKTTSINIPEGTDTYSPTLLVSTCYDYKTRANPVVCIDPRRENKLTDKQSCTPGTTTLSGGQGAPVGVTNVKSISTGQKQVFTIEISNLDQGTVTSNGVSTCPFNLDYKDLDLVRYDVAIAGIGSGECKPRLGNQNLVRLANGKAQLTCEFNIPQQNSFAYETPLQISLDYGYTQSISKQVEIVKLE